jgi:hypothetical protein
VHDFAVLDGRRLAIVLELGGDREVVLRGVAHYEHDLQLGGVLRTAVEEDAQEGGNPAIILSEQGTNLTFYRDQRYGCEFWVRLPVR